MWRDDHLPQPATEASRAVWAGAMNREVRERWRREAVDALWEKYLQDRRRVTALVDAITMRYGGQQ